MSNATERYRAALHAMQSGVKMEMEYNHRPTDPKHLRVGVNSAQVEHAALASLLIKKGIFTEEEYLEALADGMEAEQGRYETHLSNLIGKKITLA